MKYREVFYAFIIALSIVAFVSFILFVATETEKHIIFHRCMKHQDISGLICYSIAYGAP